MVGWVCTCGGGGAGGEAGEQRTRRQARVGRRQAKKKGQRRRVQTAGFNQQQAVGNEITIPLLSD